MQTFYLGKLKDRREFIINPALSREDVGFWHEWFDRCITSDDLGSFLKPSQISKKTWIFIVRNKEVFHLGLCCASNDSVGRYYPFVMFSIIKRADLNNYDASLVLQFYRDSYQEFVDCISGFKSSSKNLKCDIDCYSSTLDAEESDIFTMLLNDIDGDELASNWYCLDDFQFISKKGLLTYNLYQKIFG